MTPVVVELPLRLFSESNMRDGWQMRAHRAREQRGITKLAVWQRLSEVRGKPGDVVVTITRRGKRSMDSDNLQRAAKAVRDGVSDALGRDDGDPSIVWKYAQEVTRGSYAVKIEVAAREVMP